MQKNTKKGQAKKKSKKKNNPKLKKRLKIIKWLTLVALIIGAIALILLSKLFNIKQIVVSNNNKITEAQIIELSTLKTDENMFKFLKIKVANNIKENPYIEDVKIKRSLNRNNKN